MKLAHIALWTTDPERLRDFYVRYFHGLSGDKYTNPQKGFASYFISFAGGAGLEIMQREDITASRGAGERIGLAHMAFVVGDRTRVEAMIETFRHDGYTIAGEPRMTGDGFYEGVVLDPDGNSVELVAQQ